MARCSPGTTSSWTSGGCGARCRQGCTRTTASSRILASLRGLFNQVIDVKRYSRYGVVDGNINNTGFLGPADDGGGPRPLSQRCGLGGGLRPAARDAVPPEAQPLLRPADLGR